MSEPIVLAAGEQNKIVSQPQANTEYNIDVKGATGDELYLSHNPTSVVREGKLVTTGDRATLANLNGKPMYAKADIGNFQEIELEIQEAAFNLIFQPRAVIGATQRDDGTAANAATDSFVHRFARNVDTSGTPIAEVFEAPDRADFVVIHVESNTSDPVDLTVDFQDSDRNVLTSRDSAVNDAFAGTEVFVRLAVASPFVTASIGGSSTDADYSIYAR